VAEELFDVVDADDRVVGRLPRSEVHARGLLHRAVSIFVFDKRGRLLVHQRSATKDEFPLKYTSSASGHVTSGETYDETAPRELREELGLSEPLTFLAKFPASRETANEHTALYMAVTDETPIPDPEEIAGIVWWDVEELATRVAQEPADFTPPFRVLFRWYLEHRGQRP
jgi:isopentenyl-diphosphate Delta-isomerase